MNQNTQDKQPSRRKFIKRILGIALTLELGYVLFGLLGKRKSDTETEKWFNAGNANGFEIGQTYPFSSGRFNLVRYDNGGFLAISLKCTHLGCMVQRESKNNGFACPCHASKFNNYGEVLSAPATRALDLFPVSVENGELMVDIDHPIKRQKFEASQLTFL